MNIQDTLTCFKAYDIRGKLGYEMNEGIAYRIGRATAQKLRAKTVALGFDSRETSPLLAHAVANGVRDAGSDVLDLHEILDWDGDQTPDIIVPDVTHRRLNVVSFKSGEAKVIAEKEFPLLVVGPIKKVSNGIEFLMSDDHSETWLP